MKFDIFITTDSLFFNGNCQVIVLGVSLFATLHIKHADTSVFCFLKCRILCCLNNGSAGCLFFLKDIFVIASFNLFCIGFRLLAATPPYIKRPYSMWGCINMKNNILKVSPEMNLLNLVNIAIPLDILSLMWLIWCDQVNLLSISMPEYLVNSFSFNCYPIILMFSFMVTFLLFFQNSTRFDLPTLRDSLSLASF